LPKPTEKTSTVAEIAPPGKWPSSWKNTTG
jgi:hypothetical protein